MDFDEWKIKEYKHWKLFLNENQCYLGRVCLVAKRSDAVDFFEMTSSEQEELFKIGKQTKQALDTLFQPDLLNYASLGNTYRHLHVHMIPRYQTERVFLGIKFIDEKFGKNYEPYDRNFKIDLQILLGIKTAIRDVLK